ncbi:universal stress protein [uncultured Draconibacterium sp.]|uniref:universal stress protein n=1 Tax=uncultured Draconibacterium sp. TaxID=1573823 RepID=UPI003216B94D
MKVLSKILWAIDVEKDQTSSIEKIKRVNNEFGSEIILMHVLPNDLKKSAFKSKVEKSVRSELQKIKEQLSVNNEFSIHIRVEIGSTVESILRVSREENVNVIFLNKGKKESLGKNAVQVFRRSRKPVTILSEVESGGKNHIVCPVDFSRTSESTLRSAIIHARKNDAKLSVISVYEPVNVTSPRMMRLGLDENKENRYHLRNFEKEFKTFLKDFEFAGLEVTTKILIGVPDQKIIKYCESANILYVGCSGKNRLERMFKGSISEKVIKQIACNIISVKTEEVFKLRIPAGLVDIDKHYKRGMELIKLGYLREAVSQFKAGLQVNNFHLPSMLALSNVFRKLGDKEQSRYYRELFQVIKDKMLTRKIEAEIRRSYRTAL